MIEERWGPLRRRAWLITEVARGRGANRYIPDCPEDGNLQRLAATVTAFGENGLVHGDMKATNFIMSKDSVQVIDLDSMRRPFTAPARRARIFRDRQRFLRNWKGELRQRFQRLLGGGFG
jgi:Ser/Thr protein kinase RdoA (MazF antagonist)